MNSDKENGSRRYLFKLLHLDIGYLCMGVMVFLVVELRGTWSYPHPSPRTANSSAESQGKVSEV